MIKINYSLVFTALALFTSIFVGCRYDQEVSVKQQPEKILPYPIHQHKMANGLNIVTVPFDSPGTVSMYTVFRVGARDEVEQGVTGFAHFFEHMMFRGTDKYSKEQYRSIIKSTGAAANANTTADRTAYHMTGSVEHLETLFDIESDRFMNLKYAEHEFKTEAGAVKGEYTKNYASPYSQLRELIQKTAFTTHTYNHTTMGFFNDIVDMPNQFEYSLTFKERFYRPEYATVIVVGDVTPKQVNALAQKYYGEWQQGSYKSEVPVEPVQTETRYTHLKNSSIPPYMSLNFKGPKFDDQKVDMAALDVLSTVLFSSTSPLYKKLVLDERKAKSIRGRISDSRDPGLYNLSASLYKKEDMAYVKAELFKALEAFKQTGADAKRLSDIKSQLKYGFAMRIDNPKAIANTLASFTQLTGDPESVNRQYAQYDSVTNEDLKMVANKYFVDSRLTIATISDDESNPLQPESGVNK